MGFSNASIIRYDAVKWIEIDNFESIPKGTVPGGLDDDGKPTYICSSLNSNTNNRIPGSLSIDGVCKIIENGRSVSLNKGYRILTNADGVWVPFFDSKIPTNALQTGQLENDDGETFTFYSGRKRFDNALTLGNILYTGVGYGQGFYRPNKHDSGDEEEIFTAVPKILFLNNKLSKRMTFNGFFIVFKVKASNAAIHLGVDEENLPKYQITLDSRMNETTIENKETKESFVLPTEDILNDEEMRSFWIFLDSNNSVTLRMGIEGSRKSIFELRNVNQFMTMDIWIQFGSNGMSEWRIPTFDVMEK